MQVLLRQSACVCMQAAVSLLQTFDLGWLHFTRYVRCMAGTRHKVPDQKTDPAAKPWPWALQRYRAPPAEPLQHDPERQLGLLAPEVACAEHGHAPGNGSPCTQPTTLVSTAGPTLAASDMQPPFGHAGQHASLLPGAQCPQPTGPGTLIAPQHGAPSLQQRGTAPAPYARAVVVASAPRPAQPARPQPTPGALQQSARSTGTQPAVPALTGQPRLSPAAAAAPETPTARKRTSPELSRPCTKLRRVTECLHSQAGCAPLCLTCRGHCGCMLG